ncbi:MAG: hypothetical protein RSE00_05005 [Clostridia bacterium]
MKDFLDYVVKNKYVIICVSIVVILYALGIVDILTRIIILFILVGGAVFIGKKLQDNENFFKELFGKLNYKNYKNYKDVYYYETKTDTKSTASTKTNKKD